MTTWTAPPTEFFVILAMLACIWLGCAVAAAIEVWHDRRRERERAEFADTMRKFGIRSFAELCRFRREGRPALLALYIVRAYGAVGDDGAFTRARESIERARIMGRGSYYRRHIAGVIRHARIYGALIPRSR